MPKAILFDASVCSGCRACQIACKSWNQRGATTTFNTGSFENPPQLTSECWMRIKFNEADLGTAAAPDIKWRFTKYQCMHCEDATCVKVCPSGATAKHKVVDGDSEAYVVMTDAEKCIGCNYCVATCPFKACRYGEKDKGVFRCRMCFDRISNTQATFPQMQQFTKEWTEAMQTEFPRNIPACVETCTTGALTFGEREDLVKQAQARVDYLKKERKIATAQTYGIDPVGGVGTLRYIYVLEDSPEAYGLPVNPTVPAGVEGWSLLAKPMGAFALGGMVVAAALNYIIHRRNAGLENEE